VSRILACLAVLLAAACLHAVPSAADFADGPALSNTVANGGGDLGDLFVFRSPTNANNTVLVLTVQPFPGNLTATTFRTGARYDIRIDRTADYRADLTLRASFGPVDGSGTQPYVLRCLPRALCPNRGLIARGRTGQNIQLYGGGLTRAGIHDNPVFFDRGVWNDRAADGVGAIPRAVFPHNYYGPNGNVLAVVVELPSRRLAPINALVAVWTRLFAGGAQLDREGRPFTPLGLVPKLPHNSLAAERRDAFNAGIPSRDLADFKAGVVSVLTGFWARSGADANAIADLWLPDALLFQVGNPNGYGTFVTDGTGGPFTGTKLGNGRRLRDDTYDTNLNIFSNGATVTDGVPDDNGTRITDGNMGTVAAFPYLGAVNLPLNGPGTGPNP
jgi:hypothetical protein